MATSKMAGLGMTLQTPTELIEPELDPENENGHILTELDETDERFKEIDIDFKNAGMKVLKLEMLQNNHLWKRYATERNLILEQREKIDSGFKLNERYLYHGTSAKKSYICDEGLDSRMSKEGCFGKGIYFSDFPKKCVKYAKKGKGEDSHVLLVRVILGEAKLYPKGQKARALRREPEKEEPYTGHRFYDSVEGCPRNHKEFVVYESRRALVEGIITFSVEKKKKEKVEPDAFFTDTLDDGNDLNANDTDSDNQSEPGGDVEGALSNLSSSDDDDGGDDKYKGYDSSDSSETTDSSDSEAGRLRFFTSDEIDQILIQKNRQFGDATGVTDQLEIERYLLRGNMNVDEAVKIYEEKKAQGFPESESEEEWEDPFAHNHPLPGSEGWDELSEEDQKAFIEGQIDDFILITGIDVDEREVARQCLTAVNMNLDNAVLAYYDAL